LLLVVRIISSVSCKNCSRSNTNDDSLYLFKVYEYVNKNKIPACKVCKKDLSYVKQYIPTVAYRGYRTSKEATLLRVASIYNQYKDIQNLTIEISDKTNRTYEVN